jgi:hypothetical protein
VGDEILKTLRRCIVITSLAIVSLFSKEALSLGNEVQAYDQIFLKIGEKRVGIEAKIIDQTPNPFIITRGDALSDENGTQAQPVYVLEATFDQKAKINGIWYHRTDMIDSFKLIKVNRNDVVLQNELEKKELYIRTKDDSNFKISYK